MRLTEDQIDEALAKFSDWSVGDLMEKGLILESEDGIRAHVSIHSLMAELFERKYHRDMAVILLRGLIDAWDKGRAGGTSDVARLIEEAKEIVK